MAHISVQDLSVTFPIYHGGARSLKKTVMVSASGGRFDRDKQNRIVVEALRGLSLDITTGTRLGVIGGNGSGKTTLLRVLAGIYEPTNGRVFAQGRMTALIDTNLGMNMELTGKENIRIRGLYEGLSEAEIGRLEEDVAEFSNLADFLHLPVRTYSTGMTVRLGFALATASRPEILLMDEWFLAGDAAFMERARKRLEDLVSGAEIVVLCSHVLGVVRQWCNKAVWLDAGSIINQGPVDEIIGAYESSSAVSESHL